MSRLPQIAMPQAGYDVLSSRERKRRRRPSIEVSPEVGNPGVMLPHGFLQSTAVARDLYRNYCQAKSMLLQFRLHVVGEGNRVMFHTPEPAWNVAAEQWYNGQWAKACDGRDDRHLHDLNGLALMSVIREHDCLAWFDSEGVMEPGTLWWWESDQIADLGSKDWRTYRGAVAERVGWEGDPDALQQDNGLVEDAYGRTLGYLVHGKRGQATIAWQDCTVLPAGRARLLKAPWRLNQKRGMSELITAAANLIDAYELLSAELQSAKVAAHLAMKVKSEDARHGIGRSDSDDTGGTGHLDIDDDDKDGRRYKHYERLSAGAIEYLLPDDDVEVLQNNRPAAQVKDFLSFEAIQAGASLGLPRFYSLMQADASYSAVRGEQNLGEAIFASWRKWLERYLLDWEVANAIAYAVQSARLPAAPAGWDSQYSFEHPKGVPIDGDKQAKADKQDLANGTRTLQDIVGPRWREKIEQRGAELAAMEAVGMPPPDQPPETPVPKEENGNE